MLEEWEIDMRWHPACKDVKLGAKERPLLEDVTQKRSETLTGSTGLCVIVIREV
jgi:hypothetical protein